MKVAFERNRGGQSIDMICRELMLDEEKVQTPKRPRTKKKKASSKVASQPADDTQHSDVLASNADAGKSASSCLVRPTVYLSPTPTLWNVNRVGRGPKNNFFCLRVDNFATVNECMCCGIHIFKCFVHNAHYCYIVYSLSLTTVVEYILVGQKTDSYTVYTFFSLLYLHFCEINVYCYIRSAMSITRYDPKNNHGTHESYSNWKSLLTAASFSVYEYVSFGKGKSTDESL